MRMEINKCIMENVLMNVLRVKIDFKTFQK